ncbi:alpha/beta hydrolase [Nocardioides sp. BP30]|uniref:alpha/beta fold hydrolase n=1 Tax=Nocardioides sp. BP30 TaxID=3036374 RepID=UPI0024689E2C|nr:alpha/beta hydrolase [Nocardioides sp. BP30]WGL53745.1 alpha/beta hydrolase [Nocardioides sp. BP30]
MGAYVDIHGHPTWLHDPGGSGETVLLLHGGLSCSDELLAALEAPLAADYRVVAFDRRGHGYTSDSHEPFHYAAMAAEVTGVIEHLGGPVHLVGWSDGGIAALLASRERPDLVTRQVLIGANFHHDGIEWGVDLGEDSTIGQATARAYAERSPDGPEHLPVVTAKFDTMARSEPTLTVEDLHGVTTPTLVLAGDDDMVRLDHTAALYQALPAAQLAVVPGASHAVPVEKPALVAGLIRDFLGGPVPPLTALPVRRARCAH